VKIDDRRALVERYVEANPDRPGGDEARLVEYGVPVWALVGHYHAVGADAAWVAEDYELPLPAVEAALACYRMHKAVIDARIAANAV
jgi:uncharacterized protein (DUF433 family)